jgi:hypothetical protein
MRYIEDLIEVPPELLYEALLHEAQTEQEDADTDTDTDRDE